MTDLLRTVSPVDGRVLLERPLAGPAARDRALHLARRAFDGWRQVPLAARAEAVRAFVQRVVDQAPVLAEELTWQIGRPLSQTPGEIRGFEDRANTMIRLAPEALAPIVPPDKPGLVRYVRREPLGVVLVLAPWNYPWLTAVNTIVPALLAGNTVLLKHSDQAPLVAERLTDAAVAAGLPEGVFQHLHVDHDAVAELVADARVAHVAFTGSVAGGRAVHRAAAGWFKTVGLELGGKDPAYVRPDAPWQHTVESVVDGAFFNAGQSCCAVERVYVHASVYDRFVDDAAALVAAYRLGDPTQPDTTLGPVVRARNAEAIEAQVADALARGARDVVDPRRFEAAARGLPYLAPRLLVDVDPACALMREETFGPVLAVQKVSSDEEAVRWMNDSAYGLTASIWTSDLDAAQHLGDQLHTGTVFLNRCDYLDPELAWVGVKDSGRGCTLSRVGFEGLTRPKSFHMRTA